MEDDHLPTASGLSMTGKISPTTRMFGRAQMEGGHKVRLITESLLLKARKKPSAFQCVDLLRED